MSKTSSLTLFHLIKSLTKAEKKHITLNLSKTREIKQPLYFKLFKWMLKHTAYDENKLLTDIPEIKQVQLPNLKLYLHDSILNQLQIYSSGRDPESKVKQGLERIALLFDKGMINQCQTTLKSIKKIAIQFELFLFLLSILDWETKLNIAKIDRDLSQSQKNKLKAEADIVFEEKLKYLDLYKQYSELSYLRHHVFILIRQERFSRKEFDRINNMDLMSHPVIKKKFKPVGFRIPQMYYSLLGIYYITLGEYQTSYAYFKSILELVRENKFFCKSDSRAKYIALYNFILNSSRCNIYAHAYFKAMDDLKEEMKKGRCNPEDFYCMKLIYFSSSGNFIEGVKYAEKIAPKVKNELQFGNIYIQLDLYFDMMYVYFGAEDFTRANYWLNKLLNMDFSKNVIDLYSVSRLIQIIIHYEMGNHELLESLVPSYYRYLHKMNRAYQFERIMVKYFNKTLEISNNRHLNHTMNQFKRELEKIKADPYEKRVFEYFDFLSWIESKIQNRPFANIVQERYLTSKIL